MTTCPDIWQNNGKEYPCQLDAGHDGRHRCELPTQRQDVLLELEWTDDIAISCIVSRWHGAINNVKGEFIVKAPPVNLFISHVG